LSILIIDNNDSFTYNLVQLIEECGCCDYTVVKNNVLDIDSVTAYSKILISPGPGIPKETSGIFEVLEKFHKTKSILGVCLGHQAIAEYFGATLINLPKPFHGIKSEIEVCDDDCILFSALPKSFDGGRYHSWAVSEKDFPDDLKITAVSTDGIIMGLSHKVYDVHGIQFHPESIMTPFGMKIIENWIVCN
jgi:anthranilate synthase component 2